MTGKCGSVGNINNGRHRIQPDLKLRCEELRVKKCAIINYIVQSRHTDTLRLHRHPLARSGKNKARSFTILHAGCCISIKI
jgi:hypothetical protein